MKARKPMATMTTRALSMISKTLPPRSETLGKGRAMTTLNSCRRYYSGRRRKTNPPRRVAIGGPAAARRGLHHAAGAQLWNKIRLILIIGLHFLEQDQYGRPGHRPLPILDQQGTVQEIKRDLIGLIRRGLEEGRCE